MKKLIVIIFILFVTQEFLSQKNTLDSMWRIYNDHKLADTNQVNALHKIASYYYTDKFDTCIILKEQEIQLALKIGFYKHAIKDLNNIGAVFCNKGDYLKAMDYSLRALKIAEDKKDKFLIADCYSCIGVIYSIQSYSEKAFEYELKALKIREELNYQGPRHRMIAEIYLKQNNYDKALEYYLKDLAIYKKQGDKNNLAWFYSKIGELYKEMKNYPKAFEYYHKSLNLAQETKNVQREGACYSGISDIYFKQFDFEKALQFAFKSLETWKDLGSDLVLADNYTGISKIYTAQRNYSKAIEFGNEALAKMKSSSEYEYGLGEYFINMGIIHDSLLNYRVAILYFDSSLSVSKKINSIDLRSLSNEKLAHVYSKAGNYRNAYSYYVDYKRFSDSIFKLENAQQLGDFKTKYEVEKKEEEMLAISQVNEFKNSEEKKRQRFIIYSVAGILIVVIVFSFFLYRRFTVTRSQKMVIEKQKHFIEEKQQEIVDSITYAKRLQEAILPPQEFVTRNLPNNFILYLPKDIVAGDFYWAEKINDLFFIAAADSTGHGVPGAMVSVVCSNALNRTVKEFKLTETGKILDKTRELVIETFEKSASEVKDGMDISLLCIDLKSKQIFWSGANNPLWYIQDNELKEIKADKQPIGKTDNPKPFATHQIDYKEATTFYLFTDGLADQFGGPKGKKFKYKPFSDLLIKSNDLTQIQQADLIEKTFMEWKGSLEQVDDVCVIGIKI